MKIKLILYKLIGLFLILINLNSCGIYRPVDAKEYPPEPEKRVKKNLEEGKGFRLFGDDDKKGGNFEFASSNPLWRAALETIDFLPLMSANYSGGIIISDWYNIKGKQDERIKISVLINSQELRADGIKVSIFKQILRANSWNNTSINPKIITNIERKIIQKAGVLANTSN